MGCLSESKKFVGRINDISWMGVVLKHKEIGIQCKIKIFSAHCGSILETLRAKIFRKKVLKI